MKMKISRKTELKLYYIVDPATGEQYDTDVWRSVGYAMASRYAYEIESGTCVLMCSTFVLKGTEMVNFTSMRVER